MSEESDTRSSFRLRDVAAIVGIALVLLALVSYGIRRLRESANQASTDNNLRQCGVAVHTAVGDYKRLPPSGTNVPTETGKFGTFGTQAANLYAHLLPYIESGPGPPLVKGGGVIMYIPTYHAAGDPSDTAQATGTSYPFNGLVFNQGGNSIGKNLSGAMPDGTSTVIMFGTGAIESNTLRDISKADPTTCNITGVELPQFHDWFPGDAKVALLQAFGSGGLSVCLGDANLRQVSPNVSAASWKAAMVPDDDIKPGSDF
jgi:hypothetical protein